MRYTFEAPTLGATLQSREMEEITMPATMLYVGADVCNRVPVLKSVGYTVEVCLTLREFSSAIRQKPDTDVVLVGLDSSLERRQAATLTRQNSHARLILFDSSYSGALQGEFDLVIMAEINPEEWLRRIAAVIEQSRQLNAKSGAIRERSAQLPKDAESVGQESIFERRSAPSQRAKSEQIIDFRPQKPDPADQG